METFVSALRASLAGEHTCRVFTLTLQRENTGCVWELSRYILLQLPLEDIAPVIVAGEIDLADTGAGETFVGEWKLYDLVTHTECKCLGGIFFFGGFPVIKQHLAIRMKPDFDFFILLFEFAEHDLFLIKPIEHRRFRIKIN